MSKEVKMYLVMTTMSENILIQANSFVLENQGVGFYLDGIGMIAFVSFNTLSYIITQDK